MLDKIHIFISLLAALIMTIIGIVEQVDFNVLMLRLVWVIVAFYFVGIVIRYYLQKHVFVEANEEITEPEQETVDDFEE